SGQTRESWGKAMVAAAQRGYRGVAMDLRGHGDSDWSPDGRYELRLFAQDLLTVLDQFGLPPITVGASLGGLAAMLAAAEAPGRRCSWISRRGWKWRVQRRSSIS